MSLYHSLGIAAESLFASRQGVDTAGHNIANAHSPGYSRQRVDLEQRMPSETRGIIRGNGVFVKNISRAHDRFLENELNLAHQGAGESLARYDQLKGVEGIFSPEISATVTDELTTFFNALQDLSSFPEELAVRTYVRESAQNLTSSFQRVDQNLRNIRNDINNRILGETEEISELTKQIAKLNTTIATLEVAQDIEANDLRDKQDKMIRELSEKIDIHYYRTDQGMVTVRGPNETLLIDGSGASSVGVQINEEGGSYDIIVSGPSGKSHRNITQFVDGGKIKGLLYVRDQVISDLLKKNNMMAETLANEFNHVHRKGYGIQAFKEQVGRDFFKISENIEFAARTIGVSDIISHSTDAIAAASSPNAPGDNVIANDMIRIRDARVMEDGGSSLQEYYANYVGVLGLDVVRTQHIKDADKILLDDVQGRRESVAGVSMDEEAMNILRWQTNFTASSRIVTTVDEMLETVLSLKR